MAETKSTRGRKKSVSTDENIKVVETSDDLTTELEKANAEKAQMAQMLAQLQSQMLAMQQQLNNQNNGQGQVVIKQNDDLTRTVKVVSMIPWTYNLSTQPLGRGKVYTFEKFGEFQNIKFSDMQDILSLVSEQFEKGYAILSTKKDYDDLGISYIYDTVLTQEKVEKLVSLNDDNSVDTILNMEEDMQEKIIGIIANRIATGISYDYNKIKKLEDNGIQINELVELITASNESDAQ
ncbi:MAG: hypothetical protein KBT03_13475 [Bacteroidales bacterium]|nr:hypothetical protein [Candidatus Scybalousia scybalohippi]